MDGCLRKASAHFEPDYFETRHFPRDKTARPRTVLKRSGSDRKVHTQGFVFDSSQKGQSKSGSSGLLGTENRFPLNRFPLKIHWPALFTLSLFLHPVSECLWEEGFKNMHTGPFFRFFRVFENYRVLVNCIIFFFFHLRQHSTHNSSIRKMLIAFKLILKWHARWKM